MPLPISLVLLSVLLTFGLAVFFTKPYEHEDAGVLTLPSTALSWLVALIFTGVLSVIGTVLITVTILAVAPGWLEFAAELACVNGVGEQVPPGLSGVMLLPEFRCVEAGVTRDITMQTITAGAQTFALGVILPIFYLTSQYVERYR